MSKKFTLNQLTEGIRARNVGQQGARLTEKWSRTGLLRGLEDTNRENMSMMLENQAAQLLRESNTMGSSEVGGFTNIAFPIVRRVFGGLVANELVSIQPMSLPSGLLFYLDYTYGSVDEMTGYTDGDSIYGGPAGAGIQSGSLAAGGQYDLVGTGFSAGPVRDNGTTINPTVICEEVDTTGGTDVVNARHKRALDYDQQAQALEDEGQGAWTVVLLPTAALTNFERSQVKEVSLAVSGLATAGESTTALADKYQGGASINLRRLNKMVSAVTSGTISLANSKDDPFSGDHIQMVVLNNVVGTGVTASTTVTDNSLTWLDSDTAAAATGGEVSSAPAWEATGGHSMGDSSDASLAGTNIQIPEIDIKIESIAVVAQTRKLRARWSPELAQDLNAYHSMDAEVELTQILSEQIALEIDREILNDLLVGANGANLYWSRAPGKFLNKNTGAEATMTSSLSAGPQFTGTVREWYETLTETIIDVANQIHRKTLRGSANFIVVGPDVATILESSVMYKPNYKLDGQGQVGSSFSIGAEKVGALSNRFTVYKDPYFPRNKILVGFKGGSYLETGYVYAPYVPLIVTPTIFQPDDFTPRKGVMTRYGKKMVRSDFYGTVTVLDMNII